LKYPNIQLTMPKRKMVDLCAIENTLLLTPKQPLLTHAQIARLIPHSGNMCLLDQLLAYTPDEIEVLACDHKQPSDHPLREGAQLFSVCLIEYAAQAMALHGALLAETELGAAAATASSSDARPAFAPSPGFIASVRNVQFHTLELDGAAAPMHIRAKRLAGSAHEVLYAFEVHDACRSGPPLATGRAAVVLKPHEKTP
jgi:predicted hotdog family 3-hydroxylacyl-ACP dehydratase